MHAAVGSRICYVRLVKLYWGAGSPYSWRAQLALAVKGIEYESHRLNLSGKEHRSEAFLKLSPRGTFPVLVDGDVVVRQSLSILHYVDRRFPDPPLFGTSAAEGAEIWRLIDEHDQYLGEATQTLTRQLFRGDSPSDPEEARAAADDAVRELATLDDLLSERTFVAGDSLSAADIVFYPTLHRLLRADSKPSAAEVGFAVAPLADRFPAVASWQGRLEQLPGVDATYPPHWRS